MMTNRSSDTLYLLIRSLEKAEKRNFKLYINRNSGNEKLKIVQLFDVLDKMTEYDEQSLQKKMAAFSKPQLANLKAHLYKQLLASLRLLKSDESIDMQLHEQFDYANILYNKGLFMQSLKILEKLKDISQTHNKNNFLTQVIALEKKIETLHITGSMIQRAQQLTIESMEAIGRIQMVVQLSNLALNLYSWYIQHGHARNVEDEAEVKKYFRGNLPEGAYSQTGFYERLYLYQSICWLAFIRQDFLLSYRYTQKWVDLFDEFPVMQDVETPVYIKGFHNLLNAHFVLRNHQMFEKGLQKFEEFANSEIVHKHENNRVQAFVYVNSAKLNKHVMQGTFSEGLNMIPELEQKVKEHELFMDPHRILVFNYKIATIYFGSGDFSKSIDHLQKIINQNIDVRNDLQCYARLLHLISHYEMGNYDIIEYLIKSVIRFMAKMKILTVVEEEIFKFLRKSFHVSPRKLKPGLEELLLKIKKLENSRFETRSFSYLDIISWLESKVYDKSIASIIHEKYLHNKRKVKEDVE